MYRHNVDDAVTYTPDDIVLFRESPFAVWMERLTLENPDHGILPDSSGLQLHSAKEHQDSIAATLSAEGRLVDLIDWELEEPERCVATLAAMRGGADFIVNGQLAVDTISGDANLLMRTSGYSELGDFLYIPCETQAGNTLHSTFRLSAIADLLHHLQGQLPPQMLIIRDGADVVPLQTEDYIYYYRAVQKRFMHAMAHFRKHRMPDPAESAHFGRWSQCASEVLKQRASNEQYEAMEAEEEETFGEDMEMPVLRVASGSSATHESYDAEAGSQQDTVHRQVAGPVLPNTGVTALGVAGQTLAEQARMLSPGSFRIGNAPGHTPNLARFPNRRRRTEESGEPEIEQHRRSTDAALQNLQFIGSNVAETMSGRPHPPLADSINPAPAPNLREAPKKDNLVQDSVVDTAPPERAEREPRNPPFLPPDKAPFSEFFERRSRSEPVEPKDSERPVESSVVDLDSAPAPALAPVLQSVESRLSGEQDKEEALRPAAIIVSDPDQAEEPTDTRSPDMSPFNNRLNTGQEFEDD